ncbi:MAG: diphosphate--fructose-6-phosphate 1-phosphotransferase [Abditibacteriota bacterium]|nr:diphosphate--fructose-6-phosphate 1-phosphotransferase [Abditibacteriota bacterium]
MKNVLAAQSGGPSPVINASLLGVIRGVMAYPGRFGRIYGALHGVEGILKEELLDISAQDSEEIALLRTTPASGAIGTCRYKLKEENEEDFRRIIEVIKAHDIGWFFYTGGNDSMDTANKISRLAAEQGVELVCAGIPKTIDNDIGTFEQIDHTPGYGSCARYWAHYIQCLNEENAGSCTCDPVIVAQAMGRSVGFIAAASRLADPERRFALQIYLAESKVTLPELADKVNDRLKRDGRVVVVVNEGMDLADVGKARDAFGHVEFSASRTTVAQEVINYLNDKGLPVRGMARCQVPGNDQRNSIINASVTDIAEAEELGIRAVETAVSCGTGYMSSIVREKGPGYRVSYTKVPLELVANSEKEFPREWITPDKTDVTDGFAEYARPLMGDGFVSVPMVNGLMRFTRFRPVFAEKKLKPYELRNTL